MKTCNVLASLLFGSLALAAPLRQRDLVYTTELVVETVVIYTTIWDEAPAVQATSTAGAFYEVPSKKPASSKAEPTSAPAYTPPVVKPSSVYTPPPKDTPKPEPSSVYTPPPPPPSSAAPAPEPSSVYTPAPAPVYTPAPAPAPVSSAAPAPPPASSSTPTPPETPAGDSFHGDITIYDNTGAAGACGKPLTDDMMIVALGQGAWGASTYDVMTGEATNPWCGKEITISYKGNTINAKIMDLCPGCAGKHDIDLSLSAWKALTGLDEKTRLQADWWVSS